MSYPKSEFCPDNRLCSGALAANVKCHTVGTACHLGMRCLLKWLYLITLGSTIVSCLSTAVALHVREPAPCLHMAFSVTHITTFALGVSSCQLGLSRLPKFLSCLELFLGFPTLCASALMPTGAFFLELFLYHPFCSFKILIPMQAWG